MCVLRPNLSALLSLSITPLLLSYVAQHHTTLALLCGSASHHSCSLMWLSITPLLLSYVAQHHTTLALLCALPHLSITLLLLFHVPIESLSQPHSGKSKLL